jgi:hypothetical protein
LAADRRRIAAVAAAFQRMVLRDTWPSLTAILCAVCVDHLRPRGGCVTNPDLLAVPLFLAALGLSSTVVGLTFFRMIRRCNAATAVSTVINAYAVTVTLILVVPYA